MHKYTQSNGAYHCGIFLEITILIFPPQKWFIIEQKFTNGTKPGGNCSEEASRIQGNLDR